jgi:hypothetical protein
MNEADKPQKGNASEKRERIAHIIAGVIVSIVGACVLFVISIYAGLSASNSLGPSKLAVPALYGLLLAVVWGLAFRRKQSGFAVGILIGTSLALLLDATCAVMFIR